MMQFGEWLIGTLDIAMDVRPVPLPTYKIDFPLRNLSACLKRNRVRIIPLSHIRRPY